MPAPNIARTIAGIGEASDATTDTLHGKLGTDTELADRSVYDLLVGTGPAAYPAAAAAANDVSIAEVVRYIQNHVVVDNVDGEIGVDISEAVWTGWIEALSITAPATGLGGLRIQLDVNKATTGLDTVATASDEFDCVVVEAADGTNARRLTSGAQLTASGAGTIALENSGWNFDIGPVGGGCEVLVYLKLSAERADAEVPYRVTYIGQAPTIVAAEIAE